MFVCVVIYTFTAVDLVYILCLHLQVPDNIQKTYRPAKV